MGKAALQNENWHLVDNVDEICSPSLLIFPDRVEHNIKKIIEIAGGTDNLRPHVKTHKIPEIIRLQMKHGIYKFKCATISETEMVAKCGAPDILLAMQPVGPNLKRFFKLKHGFKNSKISCITDNEDVIIQLSDMARQTGLDTHIWLDINCGMNRTGVSPGEKALKLYKRIIDSPNLIAEGLHAYDGHIHEPDFAKRENICNESFSQVLGLIKELKKGGFTPVRIVAGGTPTFPVHALRNGVECSPGTILLWDWGYSSTFTDMEFLHAAVLLTRIVSKPGKDLLCLDLGHKAVASEMPQPRVRFIGLDNYTVCSHNEEHMVIRTGKADNYKVGEPLYCIPLHICPTVDRYDTVTVIYNNHATGQWNVEARKRMISI
ncbi:MAG: D-TA family PLP-dependent enzyme [Bacteroidetes bacterium]|nr:MAG: D-TA family PLP-dependent enzyme [Bacteroidota bacterium]